MSKPIMPKATALWLIDHTKLTFDQIAEFCGVHLLHVQVWADDKRTNLRAVSPIKTGQLTLEEVERCEKEPKARLRLCTHTYVPPKVRRGGRYTLLSKRSDIPHAILWLVRQHPHLTDTQISRLIGTTRPTVRSVREATHWNFKALTPQDPVLLGLCTQKTLEDLALKIPTDKK